ncbi:MAG: site-2 protease family protein [Nitrospirales bacterium]
MSDDQEYGRYGRPQTDGTPPVPPGMPFGLPEGGRDTHPVAAEALQVHDEADESDGTMDAGDARLPIALFIITVFTTLWAGAYATKTSPLTGAWEFLIEDPWVLLKGIPFAATLLGILVTHEFGHYLFSRLHRVPASLPLFIPGPPHFIGTFGAIIRMRGPIQDRRALFDIGVSGPIAGFVVAVAALGVGLSLSNIVLAQNTYGLHLGEPLLLQAMAWLILGPLPDGYDVVLHPIAFAGWFGLFVTSLNLIPIGQLDGGHVAYALWGDRQRTMALSVVPVLLLLGFVGWPGWFIWVGLAGLIGLAHPPVRDQKAVLGRTRIWVGWLAVGIFVVSFAPVPFSIG